MDIALVGNPNCGKTTLFNRLTGAKQRVGNWPGVTVERKSGSFEHKQQQIDVIDLPGTYSLTTTIDHAQDEKIACDYILSANAKVIVNVVNACNLERSLYLTMQLLELEIPIIVVVNMLDVATKQRMQIDLVKLRQRLGCPVLAVQANKGVGIEQLQDLILEKVQRVELPIVTMQYPAVIEESIIEISTYLQAMHVGPASLQQRSYVLRLLEGDQQARANCSIDLCDLVDGHIAKLVASFNEDLDIILADQRYKNIQMVLADCVQKQVNVKNLTVVLDKFVLNKFLGIPIFLLVIYSMFLFAINIGGAFQDFFDFSSRAIFIDGISYLLQQFGVSDWIIGLFAVGIGTGIATTLTFIPVIGAMFLFLAFLEDSGYMARAAFVMDRCMRALGLPGKSFVPLIIGFGCNVPAVMAARSLESQRDRILTIMMSPFMSCGARLAVYVLFIAAFFPVGGQNIVFILYLIGIAMAILTGLLLRKTILVGEMTPLLMELPNYHVPNLFTLFLRAWQRLQRFLSKASKVIIPLCVLIGFLNTITVDGRLTSQVGAQQTLLSSIGRSVTPVFAPMGIQADNWPATVGIATGMLAKEVVVATLNTLYMQEQVVSAEQLTVVKIKDKLQAAWQSIPENFVALTKNWINPIAAVTPSSEVEQQVYGKMYQQFAGKTAAFSYLLFLLLYFPCVSTTAVMLRELGWRWASFSVIWTTAIAYIVAVSFYQIANFTIHPTGSLLWLLCFGGVLLLLIFGMHYYKVDNFRKVNA